MSAMSAKGGLKKPRKQIAWEVLEVVFHFP